MFIQETESEPYVGNTRSTVYQHATAAPAVSTRNVDLRLISLDAFNNVIPITIVSSYLH